MTLTYIACPSMRVRPGDVVRNNLDGHWVTIAGWDPRTTLVLAWSDPDNIGLLDKATTYSPHFLALEWQP